MTFEYMKVTTSMDSVDIEDIGNVCIKVSNDEGVEWLLQIHTSLGWVIVKQFGPVKLNSSDIDNFFYFSRQKFEYNEKRLYKLIDEFINNSKKGITTVEIISDEIFDLRIGELKDVW